MAMTYRLGQKPPGPMMFLIVAKSLTGKEGIPPTCGGAKVIIIPTETANYIMGRAHSAFVSTRSVADMEDALICDGGATCTLTKTLENCIQCKPKVVDIQTSQGATLMSKTHLCLKTYY